MKEAFLWKASFIYFFILRFLYPDKLYFTVLFNFLK